MPDSASEGGDRVVYFTVPATSGGERYRVRASIEPGTSVTLIIATSLSDVDWRRCTGCCGSSSS